VIEFLDPKAEPAAEPVAYTLGLGSTLDGPVRIGLLANGFADSETFLSVVGEALARRLPAATFVSARKPNPSILVSDAVFDDLVARCDAVVSAYGH
jgi:hypothetical protein